MCCINLFNESGRAAAVHVMAYRMYVITMRSPHYVQQILGKIFAATDAEFNLN